MARGRLISRTLGSSERFAQLGQDAGKLGEFAQALYPLIVVCADDWGRMKASASSVKWVAWPSSSRSAADFERALAAMETVGLIQRYQVQGDQLLQIRDWDEHQTGLHKRTASRYDAPPELPGTSGNFRELPKSTVPTELNRTEQNRTEQKASATPSAETFAEFWAVYPRKVGKQKAEGEWRKLSPDDGLLHTIIAAVCCQAKTPGWTKEGGEYIPHAATWLHNRRWEDEVKAVAVPFTDSSHWYDDCQHDPPCERLEDHRLKLFKEQAADEVTA